MTIKTPIFAHRPRVSLARFSFCWWRHNRLLMTSQWPDSFDAITWIVISSSLDIDFIHGDIHDRSCKKTSFSSIVLVRANWRKVVVCISPDQSGGSLLSVRSSWIQVYTFVYWCFRLTSASLSISPIEIMALAAFFPIFLHLPGIFHCRQFPSHF